MARDYYEVLGLARTATTEEITKTYKKLARQHHPDRNPGDKQAEVRFKEIQNAYEVLSDATKRSQYDQFGHAGPQMGGGPGGPGGFNFGGPGGPQIDPEHDEIFSRIFGDRDSGGFKYEDMFGGGAPGRGKGRGRRAGPSAENVEVEARVPFTTAANGGAVSLQMGARQIEVKVPAGIDDGQKLRVSGQGPGGGDITVQIRVEEHPYFRREGKDVLLDLPISISEALLGSKIEVPTVKGERVHVKIRPGTSSGSKIRLAGMGIAGGDQYLIVKIMVPKGGASDDHSRKLIEDFEKHHPVDARADVSWK